MLAIGSAVGLCGVAPASADGGRYQVRQGDTLSQVALANGVGEAELARANGIGDTDVIYAGTWLTVPDQGSGAAPVAGDGDGGTTSYDVQPGDTLIGVSARFGLDPSTVAAANGITDFDAIRSGTTLQIPSARGGSTASEATPTGGGGAIPDSLARYPDRLPTLASMDRWAAEYGVPADLLKAMTYLESGWQPGVVSSTGAVGIGQLMPDTVTMMRQRIGLPLDPWDADDNTRMTASYLRFLLDETGWDPSQALAAYYQGLGALRSHGLYDGTQAYVNAVLSLRPSFD